MKANEMTCKLIPLMTSHIFKIPQTGPVINALFYICSSDQWCDVIYGWTHCSHIVYCLPTAYSMNTEHDFTTKGVKHLTVFRKTFDLVVLSKIKICFIFVNLDYFERKLGGHGWGQARHACIYFLVNSKYSSPTFVKQITRP